MFNLLIFTEGGKGIGYGHLTRCISILQFYPYAKLIIFAKDKNNVERFLHYQRVSRERYTFYNWHQNEFPNIKNKILFVDSYLANIKTLKIFEKLSKKLIFYDDFKQRNYKIFDKKKSLIINPSFLTNELFFYKQPNFMLGPKYLMLRKAFFKVSKKHIRKNVKKVFLSLGGASHKEKEILLEKIKNLLKNFNLKIYIPNNSNDEKIKLLMEDSDFAICAGGQTILELCRMGVPTISICLADNQFPTLKYLKENKLTLFAGWYYSENLLSNVKNHIYTLKNNYYLRKKISEKLQNLIDGKGTLRIINSALGKRIAT